MDEEYRTEYKIGDVLRLTDSSGRRIPLRFIGYFIDSYPNSRFSYRKMMEEAFIKLNGEIVNKNLEVLQPDLKIFDIETEEGLKYYHYLMDKNLPSTQETYRGFLDYLRYKREIRQNPRDRLNIQRRFLRSQQPFDYKEEMRGRQIEIIPRRRSEQYIHHNHTPHSSVTRGQYRFLYWPEREVQKPLNSEDRINDGNLSFEDVQRLRRKGDTELSVPSLREFSWVDNPHYIRLGPYGVRAPHLVEPEITEEEIESARGRRNNNRSKRNRRRS